MRTTIPLTALFVLGFLLISCMSSGLRAQDVNSKGDKSTNGPDFVALASGEEISSNGETYVVLPEVRALQNFDPNEEPDRALSRLGLGTPEILQLKGNFVIYREPTGQGVQSQAVLKSIQDTMSFPVVLNVRTGQLGIVLGNLVVRLKNMADAEGLASAHGLRINRRFDHLGVVFLTVAMGKGIYATKQRLKADQRVESAEIEILENINVPH